MYERVCISVLGGVYERVLESGCDSVLEGAYEWVGERVGAPGRNQFIINNEIHVGEQL